MTIRSAVIVILLFIATTPLALAAELIGDAEKGEVIYRRCSGCHEVGAGAENRIGPELNGIFGRNAAAEKDGYAYSKGLKRMGADGLIWEFRTLDAYLENPKALVTGTRMNFPGMKNPQERADVLAYLRNFSDMPQNIPESSPTARGREVDLPVEVLALTGDRDYGEYLASECKTCHQVDGDSEGIPAIIGWPTEDFVIAMHAYKREVRPHPVMRMMAQRLSDEEIAAIAAYFATLQ